MTRTIGKRLTVPFFRPAISEAEIAEVVSCLRSGWLTTGPRTAQFEKAMTEHLPARHAVAVNSCTAALHLAVEALGLRPGQGVLVPTMTFASTAEVVRYQGAVPLLVDCDPMTQHMDLGDAEVKLAAARRGDIPCLRGIDVVGIIDVHVGGLMMDVDAVNAFATRHGLWVVEDAAHALPAAIRERPQRPWRHCGNNTAAVTCFSFYANKTITTGEGGMAVTSDDKLADRIRQMSLHGLSHDAWNRYRANSSWDYRIDAPGYKYNMTDVAASLGIHQLARAETMRRQRERIAQRYREALGDVAEIELPPLVANRLHSWHLFPIRLCLERLALDRNTFLHRLRQRGVGCSVHWRPLHLHPYYEETFGWKSEDLPAASAVWPRLISLPIFADMTMEELDHVVTTVRDLCRTTAVRRALSAAKPRKPR
jgi:dTDP-4-amino-4,6-dideoxygalactose transaminase